MTIEQEFFEAFGIEPKDKYIGKKNEMLCNHCEDNCYGCSNKLYVKKYPPITPEIVLGLEEIALNCDYLLTKRPSDERLEDDLYMWVDTTNEQNLYSTAHKSRKDAILYLLTRLKDEIQDQVKALFNA